jgi:CubicO group peptidase (beta-lactamase class C family)
MEERDMRPLRTLACVLAIAGSCMPQVAAATSERGSPATRSGAAGEALEARIRRIEQGLLPANVIAGEEPQRMSLLDRMRDLGVPGVSIAVINNYRIEWARAYGVRALGSDQPVDVRTMFQAASISKPVTAVAALRLVERGRLALDEDVNRRLRTWRVPENEFTRSRKVTLRGILTHSAGFRIMAYPGTPTGRPLPSTLDLLEGRQGGPDGPIRVVYEPGTRFEYSGAGFIILQQLLEDVTGRTFNRAMTDLVFRPAGMNDSSFAQIFPPAMHARLAAGAERGRAVEGGWLLKPNMASGGLWSTPSDLAAFAIELQKAVAGRPNRLLGPAMARQMVTTRAAYSAPGEGTILPARGLGLEVAGSGPNLRFAHGGDNSGYRSQMIALADGRGLVVLTNGGSQALLREIIRAVATEYGWPTPEYLPVQRRVVAVPEAILRRYVGSYRWPEGRQPQVGEVVVENGRLVLEGEVLQPESETRFFGASGATYTFLAGADGRVEGFRFEVPGLTHITAKVEP